MKTTLALLALVEAAFSAALIPRYIFGYNQVTDGYEALTPLTTVGALHGLLYSGWVVEAPGAGVGGVVAHSPPNLVSASLGSDVINSGTVSMTPFGTMSINPASRVSDFELMSFWFGCTVNTGEAAVAASEGCTISVVGKYAGGGSTPEKSFSFAPTSLNAASLVHAQFLENDRFIGLESVTIGIAVGATTPATMVLNVDNFEHKNTIQSE